MSFRPLPLLFVIAGLAAAVPADPIPRAAGVGGLALVPAPVPADPFPLRRVLLASDADPRLSAEVFRRLPREEFEARVRAAANEVAARAHPPRIIEARCRATFAAGQLAGTAEWRVACPDHRPAFVSLEPLALAVGAAKWNDSRPAVLTRNGSGVALWIDDPTAGVVSAPWSLRGTESADEDRFDIVSPVAPVSVWELKLPADRTPFVPTPGVLLSGPFPTDTNAEKLWRVADGTVPRWELLVRRPAPPGDVPPVRAARTVRHSLAPGSVSAVAEFRLESPRRPMKSWAFRIDPPFGVSEVLGDDVDKWAVEQNKLTVTLRESVGFARLRIGLTAPLPGGPTAWPCPTVKVENGTVGADAVEVSLHPDFKLEGWTPGDYRLATGGVPPDRGYRLNFTGTFAASDADHRRPPTVRLRSAEVELVSEEALEWRLDPERNRLTVQLKLRAARGPVPAVAVHLAAGYAVDSVTAVPDDPGLTWAANGSTVTVEPSRPLGTGEVAEWKLELHGPSPPFAGDAAMGEPLSAAVPWPKFTLASTTERQGTIRVTAGGGLKVNVPKAAAGEDGVASYRGREPEGTLSVTAARPAVALIAAEFATADRAAVRLACRADAPVHSLTVFAPGDATVRAESATARVRKLPVVGSLGFTPLFTSTNGWTAVAMSGLPDAVSGSLWRVTYPATERGELAVWVDDLPLKPTGKNRRAMLPVVCGADSTAAVVRGDGPGCTTEELRRAMKTFPPAVTVRDAPAPVPAPPDEPRYAELQLLTSADAGGRLTATLSGSVSRAGRVLAVGLPAGATIESASAAGKRLPVVRADESGTVTLPLPASGDNAVSFEVSYRLPTGGCALLRRYDSPTPALPGDPTPARRWAFPNGDRAWPRLAAQPQPEFDASEVAWAVPAAIAEAVGFALAAVLLGLAVSAVRGGGRWFGLFAALGLLLGAAVWAAPGGWPLLLRPAFAVAATGLAFVVLRRPVRSRSESTVALGPALLLLLAVNGTAQGPAPATVYFVPDPANAGRLRAFVPPTVLDRIDRLTAPALPPAVILSASYEAVAGDDTATVDATFAVRCDRATPLAVPLLGARLERATVDGKDAFPEAPEPGRFIVALPAAGTFELRLRFAVAATRRGADRELRFGVPDVPNTAVAFVAGANGRQPDVTTRRGAQKVRPTGTGPRAEADHGGGTAVAVRWRDGGPADGGKPTVSVRELALWDIGETESALTAAFAFRVLGGQQVAFSVEIPDTVEPERVVMRPVEPGTAAPRLRGWTSAPPANGWRRIEARLQEPAGGQFVLVVSGHARRPLTTRPVLRFPRAADLPDADRDSYHAVRLTDVTADGIGVGGAVDFPADPLQKEFALPDFDWDFGPVDRTVRRAPNAAAELRPNLMPVPMFAGGTSEVVATVGRRVSYDGVMRAADAATALEFDPPAGWKPTDVRGPALAGWTQSGNRVQAWFRQPQPNASVRWSAVGSADAIPSAGVPPEGIAVEVPWPRWPSAVGAAADPIRATVRAAPGFELTPMAVPGLQPVAGVAAGEFTYSIEPGSPPPGRFLLKAVAPKTAPAPKPKPVEPPKTDPPAAPPMPYEPPPVPEAIRRWPTGIVAWCGAFVLVLWLMRFGRRWRPECAAGVGALAAVAVGWSSALGVLLFGVAAVALLARLRRAVG